MFDLPDLLRLWEVATRGAHPFLSESFIKRQKYNIPNGYLPNTKTWVYTINSQVVGFISMYGSEVAGLFVDPDYHGLRVGTGLLDFVRPKYEALTLEVFATNQKARDFYSNYGFRQTDSRIHEDAGEILLCLTLDDTHAGPLYDGHGQET